MKHISINRSKIALYQKNTHISKRQIKHILFKNEQVILAEHVFAYCELVTLTPYNVGHKKIEKKLIAN